MPQIEVAFDIDANGILNVHAKDRGTAKEQRITITSSSGLDKGEVEKAVKEAESHRSEDQKRREAVEAKNALDTLVYSTQKLLEENGDKVGSAEKAVIESALGRGEEGAREQGERRRRPSGRRRPTCRRRATRSPRRSTSPPRRRPTRGRPGGPGPLPPTSRRLTT